MADSLSQYYIQVKGIEDAFFNQSIQIVEEVKRSEHRKLTQKMTVEENCSKSRKLFFHVKDYQGSTWKVVPLKSRAPHVF